LLRRYVGAQIREIASDRALQIYGGALSLTTSLTAVYWLTGKPLAPILEQGAPFVCWPFAEACGSWRIFTPETIELLVLVLLVIGVTGAISFVKGTRPGLSFALLCGGFLFKTALLLQDYRLVMNQHYMCAWAVLVYFFVPNKRATLKALIVLFYLWAGMLKLNADWLSGAGLYGLRPFGMPQVLVPAACAYVIVLELAISPWILSKRALVFWAAFTQLILFHVSSFWVVGFFYPVLMFLILSIYVLDRFVEPPDAIVSVRPLRVATVASVVLAFSALQLVPRFLGASPSVTGEGRLLALNMFDAPLACSATMSVHGADGSQQVERLSAPYLEPRLECDPIVYYELAKQRCRTRELDGVADLDLTVATRTRTHQSFSSIVSVKSFCAADLSYSIWRHNLWIHPPE
jgi:hypothetical protein